MRWATSRPAASHAPSLPPGGKIVKTMYPPLGAPDFGPFLTSIDPASADAVGAVFAGSDAIKFVKQYDEYGLKEKLPIVSTILLTDDLILQQEGKAAIGITSASHYSSALESAANKAFVNAYQKKFKRDPTLYSEASYVGARVIAEALNSAKGDVSNIAALTSAMNKVRFEAPRGQFRFDEYNSPVHDIYVFKVEEANGKLINKPIAEFKDVSQFWTWSAEGIPGDADLCRQRQYLGEVAAMSAPADAGEPVPPVTGSAAQSPAPVGVACRGRCCGLA